MFDIAKVCLDIGNQYSALENFLRAKQMYEEDGDIPQAMMAYDYLAFVTHEVWHKLSSHFCTHSILVSDA